MKKTKVIKYLGRPCTRGHVEKKIGMTIRYRCNTKCVKCSAENGKRRNNQDRGYSKKVTNVCIRDARDR